MRRAGIFLLAACAVLAAGSAASSLARAASRSSDERLQAPQPAETPSPTFFVYLPMVTRAWVEAEWVTVVDEGFETPPSDLWKFWDANEETGGVYSWARRDCRPYGGSYSAWAAGGGADGASLPCGSNYPDNMNSWMAYGPFSLADATAARLSFKLWLDVDPELKDTLCVYASSDSANYKGFCLTYQPTDWGPVTFRLDDDLAGVDMRGQPQVWIALNFVSDGSISYPGGAYVDDVVVRKCVGGTCPESSGSTPLPAAGRAGRSVGSLPAKRGSYRSGR
jgi:hypothetical protein